MEFNAIRTLNVSPTNARKEFALLVISQEMEMADARGDSALMTGSAQQKLVSEVNVLLAPNSSRATSVVATSVLLTLSVLSQTA